MKKCEIKGVLFNVEHVHGMVYLVHPKWSLVGAGKDIDSARENLIATAHCVQSIYCECPESELTKEGLKLREFIAKLTSNEENS